MGIWNDLDDLSDPVSVTAWISILNDSTTTLVMKKEHDLYSMMKVMCLFKIHAPDPVDPAGSDDDDESMREDVTKLKDAWESSTELVGKGDVEEAIQTLENHTATMKLVLTENVANELLVGTG